VVFDRADSGTAGGGLELLDVGRVRALERAVGAALGGHLQLLGLGLVVPDLGRDCARGRAEGDLLHLPARRPLVAGDCAVGGAVGSRLVAQRGAAGVEEGTLHRPFDDQPELPGGRVVAREERALGRPPGRSPDLLDRQVGLEPALDRLHHRRDRCASRALDLLVRDVRALVSRQLCASLDALSRRVPVLLVLEGVDGRGRARGASRGLRDWFGSLVAGRRSQPRGGGAPAHDEQSHDEQNEPPLEARARRRDRSTTAAPGTYHGRNLSTAPRFVINHFRDETGTYTDSTGNPNVRVVIPSTRP